MRNYAKKYIIFINIREILTTNNTKKNIKCLFLNVLTYLFKKK